MSPRAAYVHVPFCRHRCGYCNFTLLAGRDDLIDDFLRAIEQELSWLGQPRPVDTLFFGGGTPTHLSPGQLDRLLVSVLRWFPLSEGGEFSIEANPSDVRPAIVDVLSRHGVTRVSLGAQSFDPAMLAILERDHSPEEIHRAVEQLRGAVDVIGLDLIFAVPDETLDIWQSDLQTAIDLRPDHVSTYGLTFEKGTAYWSRLKRGELRQADEELERAMYAEAIDRLTVAGLEHYEVSNFAAPGRRCRHNEVYWTGGEYFAVGPGAASHTGGVRRTNHRSTLTYLKRVLAGDSPVAETEQLPPEDKARERLVFALRRLEGVDRRQFAVQTGFELDELAGPALADFIKHGMLQEHDGRIRLTRAGLFVSDGLWPSLLAGPR